MAAFNVILANCLLCLATMHYVVFAELNVIPDFMKICKTKDPDFTACVTSSVMDLRPYLAEGIPDMNVPSIEPLLLNEIVVSDANRLKIGARDLKAFGCSNFIISNLKWDWENMKLNFRIDFPLLRITALYNIEGYIVLIPVRGNGPLAGNFTNCKADVSIEFDSVDRDGIKFFHFKTLDIKVNVGKGFIRLENLFGGEKTIGDIVNQAINANLNALIKQLKPSIEDALNKVLFDIASGVTAHLTYDQLFPEE